MEKTPEGLDIYVLHKYPPDYPDHFVILKQTVIAGKVIHDPEASLFRTLDEVILTMRERGLVFLHRSEGDAESILGTWL